MLNCLPVSLSACLSACPSDRPDAPCARVCVCACALAATVSHVCASVNPTRRCWTADSQPRTAPPLWLRAVTTAAARCGRSCVFHSSRITHERAGSDEKIAATLSRLGRFVATLSGSDSNAILCTRNYLFIASFCFRVMLCILFHLKQSDVPKVIRARRMERCNFYTKIYC